MASLSTIFDLSLVILGFGLIIFIHELGHFLAARWAGIRVLAFAIGFGPAAFSYRKGLGWRAGSSEPELHERIKKAQQAAAGAINDAAIANNDVVLSPAKLAGISPTEYRINWLPFGGYVKMLGQEDLNPNAVSSEKDSYQNTPIWKRMVVISAGVVMNIITAGLLFILVFMVGLKTEPAIIGAAFPGSPAALTMPSNAATFGVTAPGLQPGDRIIEVDGKPVRQFNDLTLATAMAGKDKSVRVLVDRPTGVATGSVVPEYVRLSFELKPEPGDASKLLEIGVEPARSATVVDIPLENRQLFDEQMALMGLAGVEPGMILIRAGSAALASSEQSGPEAIDAALRASDGAPVELAFKNPKNDATIAIKVSGKPGLERSGVKLVDDNKFLVEHVLGMMPVLMVGTVQEPAQKAGLMNGDIFARLGSVEYPSPAEGINEIKSSAGREIDVTVWRQEAGSDQGKLIPLRVKVSDKGLIGFARGDTSLRNTLLSLPRGTLAKAKGLQESDFPAASVITRPGTRLQSVNGQAVSNLNDIRAQLRTLAKAAIASGLSSTKVDLAVEEPVGAEGHQARTVAWTLDRPALERLAALGWESPIDPVLFDLQQAELRASGPAEAISMGLSETKRVMVMTYLTFARLFDGTVKVEHLKGPVGIAHLGTRVAQRGFIWLLFFLALVSVNLAVINFLPLPIVDGGQFLFLLFEQLSGRPVPIVVQNLATLAGLLMIVGVFLLVTFHDIMNLLG